MHKSLSGQFQGWVVLAATMMFLALPVHAGTVNLTLNETQMFGSNSGTTLSFSGSIDVAGYNGSGAGLFEVTSASFLLADIAGSPITFDTSDPTNDLFLEGTLFAEFDASGNLLDFVDSGDNGVSGAGWGIRSFFYINEAAGTTKYDLFFDNSPSGGSFWTLYPITKTQGPGDFGLQYQPLFRAGTYETEFAAVPTGPMGPVIALGLLMTIVNRKLFAR